MDSFFLPDCRRLWLLGQLNIDTHLRWSLISFSTGTPSFRHLLSELLPLRWMPFETKAVWVRDNLSLASLRPAYLALHIAGGHIGLPLLVLTFLLSKRVSCHPTLINFCITWILYSICYSLTAYDESTLQYSTSIPKLCIAQASVIGGVSPMAAVAGVAVTVQLWSMFHEPSFSISGWRGSSPWMYKVVALAPPYLAFVAFTLASAGIIAANPDAVGAPSGLYCSVQHPALQNSVAGFCAGMMGIITGFGVVIAVNFSRRWVEIQRAFPLVKRRPSIQMCLRLGALILYIWITLGVCILFVINPNLPLPYVIVASLPLVAFLVFGTQQDVFRVWCFWKRDREDRKNPQYPARRPSQSPLQSGDEVEAHKPEDGVDQLLYRMSLEALA
ncbi:hypothetical protein OE88DRAFT_1650053 [Heliocybe sulcata]|uniref:G-protein coupled receptors family 2 profile 2 domain-containing protein n=1 Tax=Heliocybe sulcata TaxID=5364 RepID=A0A5C3NIB2_9AGAM|nr:hypothetical protein OE88DRAFT_1650053 [Heliocybe sulcata]